MGLTSTGDAVTFVTHDLVPLVGAVRAFQAPSGEVAGEVAVVRGLLERVRAATRTGLALVGASDAQAAAFDADLDRWCADLSRPPVFDQTVGAYEPPEPGGLTLLVAPLRAVNGPPPVGRFLQCWLAACRVAGPVRSRCGCWPAPAG